jgi:hypothetical protein
MSGVRFSKRCSFALLVFSALAGTAAIARNGRDFAGFYDLAGIEDRGSAVEVTLVLQLYNYSGADVRQAIVMLRELPPATRTLATFASIPVWRDGTALVIHRQVTMPREEFLQWRGHSQPNLFVVNRDESAREWQRRVQLSAHPIDLPDNDSAQ